MITILFTCCESNDRFCRPDLPEKLCTTGIIDADDTVNYGFSFLYIKDIRNSTRYITFEKSIQSEYSEENDDSLDGFSFRIFIDNYEIFNFQNSRLVKSPLKFELPDSLLFNSGETYFLSAKVRDLPEISAHSTVPNTSIFCRYRSLMYQWFSNFKTLTLGDKWKLIY